MALKSVTLFINGPSTNSAEIFLEIDWRIWSSDCLPTTAHIINNKLTNDCEK